MKNEKELVNKVKVLIEVAGFPKWLHHFGPKKYEFYQHAFALLIKQECKLSYRRLSKLLNSLGIKVPTYSALAKMSSKIPLEVWQDLLKATAKEKLNLVAIDSTGISRPLPSPYFYRRIDKPYPIETSLKLSIAIDTRTKKILSLRLRSKPSHDIKDAKYLINNLPSKPKKILADKGYDAEWLHQFCKAKGAKAIIPARNYGKMHGFTLRKKCSETFNKQVYNRRVMVESTFSAIKRKFGASVSSLTMKTKRAEAYCRAIIHNLTNLLNYIFNKAFVNHKF
jgi:transposase